LLSSGAELLLRPVQRCPNRLMIGMSKAALRKQSIAPEHAVIE
jgi:hypothetical protein